MVWVLIEKRNQTKFLSDADCRFRLESAMSLTEDRLKL